MKAVIQHIRAVHSHDPNFKICCGISRIYRNFHSFRRHFYRKHIEDEKFEFESPVQEDVTFSSLNFDDVDISDDNLLQPEIYKISQLSLNGLLEDMTMLFQQHIKQLLDLQQLQSNNVEVFFSQFENLNPFHCLNFL